MNYYETLGVHQNAEPSEIKRAYYTAVKKHSPDKDPKGFREIRVAYENLSKPDKRKEYDKLLLYDVSDQVMQELLINRDLLTNHQYKEVMLRLTDKKKPKFENPELALMLAKAYLGMGKTGIAEKKAKQILENEPDNAEAIIILASACTRRGHITKADEIYRQWLDEYPDSPMVWERYLSHVKVNLPWDLADEVNRAFDINKANLKEVSSLYLLGCSVAMNEPQEERALEFLEEFIECIKDGKDMDKDNFTATIAILLNFAQARILRPCIVDALPILFQNKHKSALNEKVLNLLETYTEWVSLKRDDRIHEVFHDLTELMINFDGCESCKKERNSLELYIVDSLEDLRPNIHVIKNNFPRLFNLHPKFFTDALDISKEEALLSQGFKTYRKLVKNGFIDEDKDFPVEKPFIREAPKVGRNSPCPCGSGKKFKRCCG